MEKAICLDNKGTHKPLGCRWEIKDKKLVSLPLDPFCEGTTYHYISPTQTLKDFKSLVGGVICGDIQDTGAEEQILDKSNISFRCVYLPVLKCGDTLLALNTVKNTYVIKQYFKDGTMPAQELGNRIQEMQEGCIDLEDAEIYPIDLSRKEIEYLISYYHLNKEKDHYEVVFCPFFLSELAHETQRFTATKLAADAQAPVVYDYDMDDDSLFKFSWQMAFIVLAFLLEAALIISLAGSGSSLTDMCVTYMKDYFSTVSSANEGIRHFLIEGRSIGLLIMLPVYLVVLIILFVSAFVIGAMIVSGIILTPVLLGVIISGAILVLYRKKKRKSKLGKYCLLAKIDPSDMQTQVSRKDYISNIVFSIPMLWPFVIITIVYVTLKYLL